MFIRTKTIKGKKYAYLISNRYHKRKKESRQKSSKYLGKIVEIENNSKKVEANTIEEAIINTLSEAGFLREGNSMKKENLNVDLSLGEVKQNNVNICIKLNDGYLCSHTLKKLLNFIPPNSTKMEIAHKFAEAFISAGIDISQNSFISIFSSTFKELK